MSNISIKLNQSGPTAMQLVHDTFNIHIDRPESKGGGGTGLMGGQYLLLGIAGCFCSNLFAAAQARELDIQGLSVHIVAEIGEELPKRFTKVHLQLSYEACSDPGSFTKLVQIAEKGCLSINTVKHGMQVYIE